MARFDVYPNPDAFEAEFTPYFLDVQNDHLQGFSTRVLVPLWHANLLPRQMNDLNPSFEVKGSMVVMDTPSVGAVAISVLKPAVANLSAQQLQIQNALDILFGGY
jgi:toxin CcdB